MDRGLKRPPEDEQKRDRRDTNGQCSKPIHHALSAPRSSLGVSLLPSLKEVLARNAARPVSRQRKKYRSGWLPTHVQLQRDFAPPKGGERPAALTPQRGLAGWRRTKLRLAAGRLLVALGRVRVLFLCAKHLFVAAIDGWVHRGLRRIGRSERDGGAGRVRSRCSSQGTSKAKRPTRETPRQKAMG
jgi:hypothetical protein